MAGMEDAIDTVHSDLRAMRAEANAKRENPTIIRLIDHLITLTSAPGDTKQPAAVNEVTATTEGERISPTKAVPAMCPPHTSLDIFGHCKRCHKCQHTRTRNGKCTTCGESVTK